MRPSALELFSMYYLGVGPDFEPRFYNAHSVARHFGVSADQVMGWLSEYHMLPDVFPHIDFNVAKAHGQALDVSLTSGREAVKGFCRSSFEEFRRKLEQYDPTRTFEDLDYDRIWGDEEKPKSLLS